MKTKTNENVRTPMQRWVSDILQEDVVLWLRRQTEEQPLRLVTRELREITGERLDLTEQTLRNWLRKAEGE